MQHSHLRQCNNGTFAVIPPLLYLHDYQILEQQKIQFALNGHIVYYTPTRSTKLDGKCKSFRRCVERKPKLVGDPNDTLKNLFCIIVGCNRHGKGLGRWDTTPLPCDPSIDLNEQGLFATPMYHDMGKMWRLTFRTLYYIWCTQLQNHNLLT